jgi:hypothetical protein
MDGKKGEGGVAAYELTPPSMCWQIGTCSYPGSSGAHAHAADVLGGDEEGEDGSDSEGAPPPAKQPKKVRGAKPGSSSGRSQPKGMDTGSGEKKPSGFQKQIR